MKKRITIPEDTSGIIFDLDGTLIDSMPIHFEAYNHVLSEYGITYDWETFTSRAGIPSEITFRMIKEKNEISSMDVKSAYEAKRYYYAQNFHKATIIEPVFNIAKEYLGRIPMSIGTGSHYEIASKTIKLLGLDRYIPILVTFEDVENPKPHPDTFLKCAQLMGSNPADCIVLEDGVPGIEAAKAAGMKFIDVREHL